MTHLTAVPPPPPAEPPTLDMDQAQRFLAALDSTAERFVFQTFDDSPAKRRDLARTLPGTLTDQQQTLADLNRQGAGVFVTVNEVAGDRRTTDQVTRVRAVFADFDGTEPPATLPLEPSIRVQSAHGQHLYWLVDGLPLDRFPATQKAIAATLGSDPAVHDLPRVMRLPGSWHRKDPARPVLVELIEAAFPSAACEPAPPPAPLPSDTPAEPAPLSDSSDRYARSAIERATQAVLAAPEGTRNDTLNREAHGLYGLVKAGRLDYEAVTDALRKAALAAGLSEEEVSTTLFSAMSAARPRDVCQDSCRISHAARVSTCVASNDFGLSGFR